MLINFITTESLESTSGGWNGMNYHIFNQLNTHNSVSYIGPIKPPIYLMEKIISKFLRLLGLKGNFFFFSEKRLTTIFQQIRDKINNNCDLIFFHGSTPWIKFETDKPYYAYIDASFYTFLHTYTNPKKFRKKDIERIMYSEKAFLKNARQIFFSSQWAMDETKVQYQLSGTNFSVVGLGGNIKIPNEININPSPVLLFISVDFHKKGGLTVVKTFEKLKGIYPHLSLSIVGEKPPAYILKKEGIKYHGFLDKNIPSDITKLNSIFTEALLLIHPTQKDMTPLVIIEAGYFGVPTIAPSKFGIPEMILDGKTGFLINQINSDLIADKVSQFISNNKSTELRKNTREYFIHHFTWEQVGKTMQIEIEKLNR
jgi:glycosyltransferase involved in cell wall biosynthesis